jgi:copper chaperone CopZ
MVVHKERLNNKGPLAGKRSRWVQIKGECGLHLFLTSWTIMEDDDVAATIDSPYEGCVNSIKAALHRLEGKKVEKVEIDADATTIFTFDLGGKLICKRFDDWQPDEELWSLRTPNGYYGLQADGNVTIDIAEKVKNS